MVNDVKLKKNVTSGGIKMNRSSHYNINTAA